MKFVVGMLVGIGAGVAATLLATKRNEQDAQYGLVNTLQTNARRALDAAKSAASQREKELWSEFHDRVPSPDQPLLG